MLNTPTPTRMQKQLAAELGQVQSARIVRVEARSNYSRIYFSHTSIALVLAITLQRIEEQLPAAHFLRIHRSHLINKSFIKQVIGGEAKVVELQTGEKIAVSRRKRGVVKCTLNS
ncbi:MAG: LytTR family transcriptional regulator [Chitinophagaceae bacterium]|nr:LytTR family transcriptional regulator [Chitinophagaceae bacterium]